MKTYLISYELASPGLEFLYEPLITTLKSYEYWARPQKTVWLIKTWQTKDLIMSNLRPRLGNADKLLIVEVTNEWISLNLDPDVVKWMQGGM